MPSTTVLGVDPGLTRCGVGVVEGPAHRPRLRHASCIRTGPHEPRERRLLVVHDGVASVIEEHRPDVVVVERVLFSANVRTAMATGQAAGVALLAAARAGVEVVSYSPNEVKQTVAGAGDADKDAVARLVAAQLRLSVPLRPADVADAVAVALTHLARTPTQAATASASGGRSPGGRGDDGGWESVIARRGLTVSGGTGRKRVAPVGREGAGGRGGRG